MDKIYNEVFKKNKIELVSAVPFEKCGVANERLYNSCVDNKIKTVFVFALPYRVNKKIKDNYAVSLYARVTDYHKYFDIISKKIISDFKKEFPENLFFSFADHSPIDERMCALHGKIGVLGKNGLVITQKYGSFVFLGAILTDSVPDSYDFSEEISYCNDCGKCRTSCPTGAIYEKFDISLCLSDISQKKHKTDEEYSLLKKHNCVWGCDICQNACPMNQDKCFTDIDFFQSEFLDEISYEKIKKMTEDEFLRYPFSWRKKEVVLTNIKNIDESLTK